MRRTYKSKKDTGGTLDARDVLQNINEKSSVFEAFYIQNIKQTKRELSCVIMPVHNGVSSNKVRKRKYVKRILKEVEPIRQRDTMSSSAYLTPDKSIRVNKVLDPFDMLLNSTPTFQDAPKPKKENVFEELKPKKESKTYIRKKQPRLKKINYSSSDSNYIESDKENTSEQSHSNITDIRTHELLVETEPRKSPHILDESINKIVNNLSLINNFKCRVSDSSFNSSYKFGRNKLTKNFLLPTQQTSPLCSTPFKEKYRGVSIFKFSPITQRETSPDYDTVPEEKGDINISLIFNSNEDNSKVPTDCQVSPLTHLFNTSIKNKSYLLDYKIEQNCSGNIHEYAVQNEVKDIDGETQTTDNSVSNVVENSFPTEPFLGFSNDTPQDIQKDYPQLKHLQINDLIERESVINENDLETNESNIDNLNSVSDSVASNQCNTSQSSVTSNNSDKESMYDTCNSEQSYVVDDCAGSREPIVAIQRMNDSVFLRYYEMWQMKSQSEETDNDEFESLANDTNDEMLNISLSTDSDCIEAKPNAIIITDSSTTEDVISSNDEEEVCDNEDEICVSFVTTRRKHEITNDSMFIFDNSYSSTSTNCDKTVLSNIKVNLEKSDVNISLDSTVDVENDAKDNFKLTGSTVDRISSINRSSKLSRESSSRSSGDAIRNSILNGSIHSNRSSKNNNKTLKSPKQSKFTSTADNIELDLNLIKSVSNDGILKTTRKSSRLTVQYSPLRSTKDNLKPTDNSRDKRISRVKRKSNIPLKSTSTSSESDTSNNEITLIDTNETNNDDVEMDLNDLDNRDVISQLISRDISSVFIESNVQNYLERSSYAGAELKPNIVLQPGKKWERSLSIYRRMTMSDNLDQSILEDECVQRKGRKYRQSVISTMEMQECRDSLYNDSINSRRSSCISKPSRPTIRFVKDPNISSSRVSINTSSVYDDLKGFLNEECDDTVIELSKLSIADSEHEVTILDNFHETERVATARDYVLRRCNQTEPILFDECYPETVLKNCHKIGEGVYGEVFLWRGRDGRARVMKIVPIAGTIKVNGEDQKDFHEIISEIVIAMELSALRAPIAEIERQLDEGNDIRALDLHTIANATDIFNEVLAVRCLFGAYPSRLLDLWELYDECKGSENDNPAALPHDQRYIVLELANAGQDLESYQFASAQQAHALFQQPLPRIAWPSRKIAFGLAVAEEAFQFEHRDLHWGNVLIAPTEQKFATFVLRGRAYRVARCGVAATVIDYSLSRLSLPLAADSAALYNDLATDEQLFDAVGDYQFEVYRLMRDKLGNDWKNFEPYTNILWLHYTVDKMITALRYKRTNTKIHKHYIEKLKEIKERILEYGSAVQYVLTDI